MTRWIAPGSAVLGSLLLCGCSAVGTPEPACRPLETAELPMLGLVRGTWMDEERFVLVDLHQSRLLLYGADEGLVRIVDGRESADLALTFVWPVGVQPWGRGYVLADRYPDQDRLLELNANLRPIRVLWESDVEEKTTGGWSGDDVYAITRLAAVRDRLYVQGTRLDDARHSSCD